MNLLQSRYGTGVVYKLPKFLIAISFGFLVKFFLSKEFADDWTRTNTLLLGVDFESTASTISPHRQGTHCKES